jgi:hypothetical protein
MLRTCPSVSRRERPARPPQFDLRSEVYLPGFPLICVLVPRAERVEVIVNTAYGMQGYLHAAWHAAHGLVQTQICQPGVPCGYRPDP